MFNILCTLSIDLPWVTGKRKEFLPQQERVWFSLRDGRGYRLGRIVELSEAGPILQTDGHDQELGTTNNYDHFVTKIDEISLVLM